MVPIVNKAKRFQEAHRWDILQQVRMTPQERLKAAQLLKERVYGRDAKDVREWYDRK